MNNTGQYNRDIKEAVQKLSGTFLKDDLRIIQATVNCVHIETYTCDCTPISGDNSTDFCGVNLSANNNDGFIPIPAIGSTVLIAESTKNNPAYLIGWDLLQGLLCIVQNKGSAVSQVIIGSAYTNTNEQGSNLQFNDGSYGGLVILQKVVDNLNAISNYLTALNTAISSGFSAVGAGSAANGATGASTFNSAMASDQLTFEDMENTKVTHGV